jgi:GTP-binding protein Era
VRATLYVEREGQKRILIGREGARLKEIGRLARLDVEALTGHKAFLDLWVKVRPGWRESESDLRLFGIKERTS